MNIVTASISEHILNLVSLSSNMKNKSHVFVLYNFIVQIKNVYFYLNHVCLPTSFSSFFFEVSAWDIIPRTLFALFWNGYP